MQSRIRYIGPKTHNNRIKTPVSDESSWYANVEVFNGYYWEPVGKWTGVSPTSIIENIERELGELPEFICEIPGLEQWKGEPTFCVQISHLRISGDSYYRGLFASQVAEIMPWVSADLLQEMGSQDTLSIRYSSETEQMQFELRREWDTLGICDSQHALAAALVS